uniref:FYVE_2 domain-containing protein n=1 Tax=Macrostomum lignano TaxID=282301 RepID=A0A1I8GY75_9PLAT
MQFVRRIWSRSLSDTAAAQAAEPESTEPEAGKDQRETPPPLPLPQAVGGYQSRELRRKLLPRKLSLDDAEGGRGGGDSLLQFLSPAARGPPVDGSQELRHQVTTCKVTQTSDADVAPISFELRAGPEVKLVRNIQAKSAGAAFGDVGAVAIIVGVRAVACSDLRHEDLLATRSLMEGDRFTIDLGQVPMKGWAVLEMMADALFSSCNFGLEAVWPRAWPLRRPGNLRVHGCVSEEIFNLLKPQVEGWTVSFDGGDGALAVGVAPATSCCVPAATAGAIMVEEDPSGSAVFDPSGGRAIGVVVEVAPRSGRSVKQLMPWSTSEAQGGRRCKVEGHTRERHHGIADAPRLFAQASVGRESDVRVFFTDLAKRVAERATDGFLVGEQSTPAGLNADRVDLSLQVNSFRGGRSWQAGDGAQRLPLGAVQFIQASLGQPGRPGRCSMPDHRLDQSTVDFEEEEAIPSPIPMFVEKKSAVNPDPEELQRRLTGDRTPKQREMNGGVSIGSLEGPLNALTDICDIPAGGPDGEVVRVSTVIDLLDDVVSPGVDVEEEQDRGADGALRDALPEPAPFADGALGGKSAAGNGEVGGAGTTGVAVYTGVFASVQNAVLRGGAPVEEASGLSSTVPALVSLATPSRVVEIQIPSDELALWHLSQSSTLGGAACPSPEFAKWNAKPNVAQEAASFDVGVAPRNLSVFADHSEPWQFRSLVERQTSLTSRLICSRVAAVHALWKKPSQVLQQAMTVLTLTGLKQWAQFGFAEATEELFTSAVSTIGAISRFLWWTGGLVSGIGVRAARAGWAAPVGRTDLLVGRPAAEARTVTLEVKILPARLAVEGSPTEGATTLTPPTYMSRAWTWVRLDVTGPEQECGEPAGLATSVSDVATKAAEPCNALGCAVVTDLEAQGVGLLGHWPVCQVRPGASLAVCYSRSLEPLQCCSDGGELSLCRRESWSGQLCLGLTDGAVREDRGGRSLSLLAGCSWVRVLGLQSHAVTGALTASRPGPSRPVEGCKHVGAFIAWDQLFVQPPSCCPDKLTIPPPCLICSILEQSVQSKRQSAGGCQSSSCPLCAENPVNSTRDDYRCRECRRLVCYDCGSFCQDTGHRFAEWICAVCQQRRHLAASSGSWFHGLRHHQSAAMMNTLVRGHVSISSLLEDAEMGDFSSATEGRPSSPLLPPARPHYDEAHPSPAAAEAETPQAEPPAQQQQLPSSPTDSNKGEEPPAMDLAAYAASVASGAESLSAQLNLLSTAEPNAEQKNSIATETKAESQEIVKQLITEESKQDSSDSCSSDKEAAKDTAAEVENKRQSSPPMIKYDSDLASPEMSARASAELGAERVRDGSQKQQQQQRWTARSMKILLTPPPRLPTQSSPAAKVEASETDSQSRSCPGPNLQSGRAHIKVKPLHFSTLHGGGGGGGLLSSFDYELMRKETRIVQLEREIERRRRQIDDAIRCQEESRRAEHGAQPPNWWWQQAASSGQQLEFQPVADSRRLMYQQQRYNPIAAVGHVGTPVRGQLAGLVNNSGAASFDVAASARGLQPPHSFDDYQRGLGSAGHSSLYRQHSSGAAASYYQHHYESGGGDIRQPSQQPPSLEAVSTALQLLKERQRTGGYDFQVKRLLLTRDTRDKSNR